ncbi:YcaO-like family protein [Rhizobium sp. BE258]|uniref:YcaO-like family protein n=1 Tax=Rhizobium sp. BE258 TaxID=2817722 RepID=UPI000DD8FECA|nr:YcaO-like family protein [Rhizobium sp. BE258]MDR7142419.1 ribosomal protein S12 methylthiotransferase accessory factor [Rhizobium sp. BE258]
MDEIAGEAFSAMLENGRIPSPPDPAGTVRRILERKRDYGITRLGSVTELDWIGIPVVQVVRPRSLSVAVSQGKGLTVPLAAISGLMESLEGWASERIDPARVFEGTLGGLDPQGFWTHLQGTKDTALSWINGVDLFSGQAMPVPLGLADSAYTFPSPHPAWMPRDTTGLAAGTSLEGAVAHACLECLERHARCEAMATPHFFDRYQVDARSVQAGKASEVLRRLSGTGFIIGIWKIPAPHDLPVYWCHVMEDAGRAPFAPLPAEGFGCALTDDAALTSALLEACQSRLGVISAARDDISAELYRYPDESELWEWRAQLSRGGSAFAETGRPEQDRPLRRIGRALRHAGARAAILVSLHVDETIPLHVVRVITPPLQTNPEADVGR